MSEAYEAASMVRAMLNRPELTDEEVTVAASALGWPAQHPHPYLVAQRLDR